MHTGVYSDGMSWSEYIRDAVKKSGKTTYKIAVESGVPVQTVDRFMAGADAKLSTAEKIGQVVGVEVTDGRVAGE
jgi:hypothetical protein